MPYQQSATLQLYRADTGTTLCIPYAEGGISAGFPSPAQDFTDNGIDLNRELIKNPSSTFFGRAKGNSMQNAGISDGDLLVIDKSLTPANGKIAVCCIDGEFTVKRIKTDIDCCWLLPANDQYKPIRVGPENNLLIWGIVVHVIKSV